MTKCSGLMLLMVILLAGCHRPWRVMERCPEELPAASRQALVVDRDVTVDTGLAVRRYARQASGWRAVGEAIPVVAGRSGFAAPGAKREGDGRTPAGLFPLERGFGYGPLNTRITHIVLTPDMIWIDDPRSSMYNTLVDRREGERFSHEIMRRRDDLYKYGLVVEYNTKTIVPGAGSAIFFHVWRSPASATAGCVAMAESDMVSLLTWLDPASEPLAVIGNACR